MITSSVLNSITAKYLDGGNPNKWNTLHADRNQGGFTVVSYCQKFQKDETIYLQFTSDSSDIPTMDLFAPHFIEQISGTLASSYTSGESPRYFFNFELDLGSDYYDEKIYFEVTQDTDILTSEPFLYTDLSEDLEKGFIRKVKYTNLDRNNSDLSNYWVDWSVIDFMQFYVESVDVESNDSGDTEVLESSQSKTIVSANNYSGINLQTGGIPDYLCLKIDAASSLDYFEVNEIQYIKESTADISRLGNSTLKELSLGLTEKNTIGLNVDDLGIEYIDQEDVPMSIIPKRNTGVTSAGWQVSNPEGYALHSIWIKHALTSAGDATIKLGTTVSGSEIIDEVQGNIPLATYSSTWRSYPAHFLEDPDNASTLYLTLSGAGAVLDIIMNFDTVTEQ